VKAQRAEANHEGQRGREELEIAGSPHGCIVAWFRVPSSVVQTFRGSVPGETGDPTSRATSEYSSGCRGVP
jgi:hypothetical protein